MGILIFATGVIVGAMLMAVFILGTYYILNSISEILDRTNQVEG